MVQGSREMPRREKDIVEAFPDLFEHYGTLVSKADSAFRAVERDYGPSVRCRIGCSDCCHAIFGLFPIEAVYTRYRFHQLGYEEQRAVLSRADKAERELEEVARRLRIFDDDPHVKSLALARERVRCPLLDTAERCTLYHARPITCRVYGIPTAIHGTGHVCAKAAFEKGKSYPVYDLDMAHRALYGLSRGLFERLKCPHRERASFMLSMPKVLKTPLRNLLR